MAEVRRRLLRRGAQLHVGDVMAGVRVREAVLAACSMTVASCNRGTSACTHEHKHSKWTLWPSCIPRGQCVWVPDNMAQIAPRGVCFYSQGRQSRSYRHGNNGVLESDMPLYMTRTGYYDVLEVSGNATQAQIKTAYYKQSFRFHPDRNSGDETAARCFGQVTEAYHILGNTGLRKKYDRGILSLDDVRTARKPSGKSSSPSRKEASSQRQASSASASSITKPMFNFDAFYQAHYGEQLERERRSKERRERIEKQKREKNVENHLNNSVDLCVLLLFLPGIFLYLTSKD